MNFFFLISWVKTHFSDSAYFSPKLLFPLNDISQFLHSYYPFILQNTLINSPKASSYKLYFEIVGCLLKFGVAKSLELAWNRSIPIFNRRWHIMCPEKKPPTRHNKENFHCTNDGNKWLEINPSHSFIGSVIHRRRSQHDLNFLRLAYVIRAIKNSGCWRLDIYRQF